MWDKEQKKKSLHAVWLGDVAATKGHKRPPKATIQDGKHHSSPVLNLLSWGKGGQIEVDLTKFTKLF